MRKFQTRSFSRTGRLIETLEYCPNIYTVVSGLSSFLKKSVPATDYIVCGDTVLKIDGQIREGVCEVLFERDEDKLNIPSMILDALLASPIGE